MQKRLDIVNRIETEVGTHKQSTWSLLQRFQRFSLHLSVDILLSINSSTLRIFDNHSVRQTFSDFMNNLRR